MMQAPAMTQTAYANAFDIFKQHANEQHDTLQEVKQRVTPMRSPTGRVRALSIGTGSGEVDLPIIAALCPPKTSVDLHCVEINEVHARQLEARSHAYPELQPPPTVHPTRFEEPQPFETGEDTDKFDLVLASHSIYYFQDRPAFLRKVGACLKPEGRLLLTVNEPQGLGQVYNFYRELEGAKAVRPAYVGETAVNDLSLSGFTSTTYHVQSHVDVTDVVTGGKDGDAILSVFLDQDCQAASPPLRAAVTDFVAGLSFRQGERTLFPQNIALIEARLRAFE